MFVLSKVLLRVCAKHDITDSGWLQYCPIYKINEKEMCIFAQRGAALLSFSLNSYKKPKEKLLLDLLSVLIPAKQKCKTTNSFQSGPKVVLCWQLYFVTIGLCHSKVTNTFLCNSILHHLFLSCCTDKKFLRNFCNPSFYLYATGKYAED